MSRWMSSGLQALVFVILVPLVIPDGNGGTQQSWRKLLLDPVRAWRFDYYLEPYQKLFQQLIRTTRDSTGPVTVQVHKARDGSVLISNLPDAKGKPMTITDNSSELLAPTKFQGWLTMGACWLIVFLSLAGFRYWQISLLLPKKPDDKLAELIPYTVESRVTRPMKDILDVETEPHNDLEADAALRRQTPHKVVLIEETETERQLLR